MSLPAVIRAEIKTWERDFASKHGRDPSVQDIRDQPAIAEKYKLYKKLSRAPAASQTPRVQSRLPAPKSRPAESALPLPGFNPFSPVKKSTKHGQTLALAISHASQTSRRTNAFATPVKNKPIPRPRTATPSSDPFPSVLLPHPNVNASSSHGHRAAVSRARKRLRGEPVSPSPNKPKRQRILSQPPLNTSEAERFSSSSENEADQELPQCDFASSFVADSPVKAPAGGKLFKLLFDDALPPFAILKKSADPSVASFDPGPDTRLLQRAAANRPVPSSLRPHHDLRSKGVTPGLEHQVNRTKGRCSGPMFPSEDHLSAPSYKATFKSAVFQESQPRTPMKRALDGSDSIPLQSQYSLIPPSPPPLDSVALDTAKGKGKATAGRKKIRVEVEESIEGADSPDDITLKVATVSLDRSKHRHADEHEWDPLLHLRTRSHDPAAEEHIDASHHAQGTFSVDLPDKFRRVLAISPPRNQNGTEERVIRGLLYGDRVGHYDPSRGGDIWDAGEADEGIFGDAETEDDWEGEPVPWEVGEL